MTMANSGFPTRLAFAQAQAIVREVASAQRLPPEQRAVTRTAGSVLAQDVIAPLALPPFANSAMDGFALRADDSGSGASLQLVGEQFAGLDAGLAIGPGQCVRITTGAPIPAGADAVVMKEDVRVVDGRLHLAAAVAAGKHVRPAGEDVAVGDLLMRAGTRLSPAQASLAAAVGLADLAVSRRPTVAVFTTGDELCPPGLPLRAGQIHDSNGSLLMNLLLAEGLDPVAWPILPDDPARMRALLRDAGEAFDVVLTCGGVSAGEKDHLPGIVAELGAIHFWKVMMRPGMPVLFGRIGQAQVLGLPGNPVAVLASFLTFGRQLLRGLQGDDRGAPTAHARLTQALAKSHDRREFLRGQLLPGDDGVLRVRPHPATGSHRLRGAADSDALIVLPEQAHAWAAGDVLQVLPY